MKFTETEVERIDNIVYSICGTALADEGYRYVVYDTGVVKFSHKDKLMPKLSFDVFLDSNDDISFFANIELSARFLSSETIDTDDAVWYAQRWLKVFTILKRVEIKTYSLY